MKPCFVPYCGAPTKDGSVACDRHAARNWPSAADTCAPQPTTPWYEISRGIEFGIMAIFDHFYGRCDDGGAELDRVARFAIEPERCWSEPMKLQGVISTIPSTDGKGDHVIRGLAAVASNANVDAIVARAREPGRFDALILCGANGVEAPSELFRWLRYLPPTDRRYAANSRQRRQYSDEGCVHLMSSGQSIVGMRFDVVLVSGAVPRDVLEYVLVQRLKWP